MILWHDFWDFCRKVARMISNRQHDRFLTDVAILSVAKEKVFMNRYCTCSLQMQVDWSQLLRRCALLPVASITDAWLIKMNGLISDPSIVLSSLQNISALTSSKRNHQIKSIEGFAAYEEFHDIVCVALETKFQYITFERGKQVAVFDIVVVDSSLISNGNWSTSHFFLSIAWFY